ncbi:MAG TPA: hypothetical protein VGE01_06260 [Fimbriimonas sp.]
MPPLTLLALALASPFYQIHVVDAETGRGVPLVELETVNKVLHLTDSGGWIAFNEPGMMGKKVYFHVRSHGYEVPADGFGYRGVALDVKPGGSAEIRLKRINLAERLCRLTGAGIYRDSLLLGKRIPLREPVLNREVLGQDTAQAIVHRGRMLWFWGDTDRLSYPLGNFQTTGAFARFPKGAPDARNGLEFSYFESEDGFVKKLVPGDKPGPIWISGLVQYGPRGGEELYAYYSRMKSLGEKHEHGIVKWSEAKREFEIVREIPLSQDWQHLEGHVTRFLDDALAFNAGGFCFPGVRVRADEASHLRPEAYEAFTCLNADGSVRNSANGRPEYRWQSELPPIQPADEMRLVKEGKLAKSEARYLPVDAQGTIIVPHGGSVDWNDWRKKWIAIFTRFEGKDSLLGEIYYSEADHPTGPWTRAAKVATHDRYTFYNPVRHAFLDTDGGRVIYFEGTYTHEFSGNPSATPRYNYNQILYRLDLASITLVDKPPAETTHK